MHRKYALFIGLPLMWAFNALSCMAGGGEWQGCASIAQSKKHNLFLGTAVAQPSVVSWEGHTVAFREIWLERCALRANDWKALADSDWLCFDVLIDGKREFGSLWEKDSLAFVPIDTPSYDHATFVDYTPATSTKIALFGRNGFPPGYKRHVIMLGSHKIPAELKVRVATAGAFENGKSKITPSNVEVTLHLPQSP